MGSVGLRLVFGVGIDPVQMQVLWNYFLQIFWFNQGEFVFQNSKVTNAINCFHYNYFSFKEERYNITVELKRKGQEGAKGLGLNNISPVSVVQCRSLSFIPAGWNISFANSIKIDKKIKCLIKQHCIQIN